MIAYRQYFIAFISLFFFNGLSAQDNHFDLPKLDYTDYGYKKPVKEAYAVFYKVDSLSYEAKRVEMFVFNSNGKIAQRVIQDLREPHSQEIVNYVYREGLLDSLKSINTDLSYNSSTHFIYNQKKQLVKEVCVGKYGEDVKDYMYNLDGSIDRIEFKRRTNRKIITTFFHKNGQLDYVEEAVPNGSQADQKTRFYYFNGKILASNRVGTKQVVLYQYDFGEQRQDVTGDIMEVVDSFRNKVPGEKEFLRESIVFFQTHEAENMVGDWTKRYQSDTRYKSDQTRYVFRKIIYADGEVSGNTEYDFFFKSRLEKMHKLN